jgi:hypothetical protein
MAHDEGQELAQGLEAEGRIGRDPPWAEGIRYQQAKPALERSPGLIGTRPSGRVCAASGGMCREVSLSVGFCANLFT